MYPTRLSVSLTKRVRQTPQTLLQEQSNEYLAKLQQKKQKEEERKKRILQAKKLQQKIEKGDKMKKSMKKAQLKRNENLMTKRGGGQKKTSTKEPKKSPPIEKRVICLGLDAGGKTTILYRLKLGDTINTIPTIGFNVESVNYKNFCFTLWDVGGQEHIRKLWHHYYLNTDAIIFVIDSNNTNRIEEAKRELYTILENDEIRTCPILVYANKQDLPDSLPPSELVSRLDLPSKIGSRQWHCQGSVGTSGEGLYEGLEWLSSTLTNSK